MKKNPQELNPLNANFNNYNTRINVRLIMNKEPHTVTMIVRAKSSKYYTCQACNTSYPSYTTLMSDHTKTPIIVETLYK